MTLIPSKIQDVETEQQFECFVGPDPTTGVTIPFFTMDVAEKVLEEFCGCETGIEDGTGLWYIDEEVSECEDDEGCEEVIMVKIMNVDGKNWYYLDADFDFGDVKLVPL